MPKELEQEPKLERLARISAELASHNKEVKIYVRENWESLKGVEPLGRGRQQCGEWVRAERIYVRCVASHLSEIIGKDERVFTYLINCSGFKVMFIITPHSFTCILIAFIV